MLLCDSDTPACGSCATSLFLPHFDVICDLLLNRRTATWNLFVNQLYSTRDTTARDQSMVESGLIEGGKTLSI